MPSRIRDKLWQRERVQALSHWPQPRFVAVRGASVEQGEATHSLVDYLRTHPGSYILKPRFGSNGVAVVRIVCETERFACASDCPDTAMFLDEHPCDPQLGGADVVTAIATQRHRFVNRATAGLSESTFQLSILEAELPQHRCLGELIEPRIVIQRVSHDEFAVVGAIAKHITTPIGATVARDYREVPLAISLQDFISEPVKVQRDLLDAAAELHHALLPSLIDAGVRVHQYGIDCRLCWNAETRHVEFPLLELQFGIGRIDSWMLPGYRTRQELCDAFGAERE